MRNTYLDNAASTPLLAEVQATMLECMNESFGNSSSIHTPGVQAIRRVERAREIIANSLNASSEEFYFTCGGTESNNWVIKSFLGRTDLKNKKIITSAIEHPSILVPLNWLAEYFGIQIIKIGVDSEGIIKLAELEKAMDSNVLLCTIMHVNNEVGSIQPLNEISKLCEKFNVPFHVDACQSFIKVPLNLSHTKITYLTINAHKLHGPKGVGALYMRKGHELPAFMHGGGHEMNLRSGTLNVPGIVGFGKAVELQAPSSGRFVEMGQLLKWLSEELKTAFPTCKITGHVTMKAPHILNVRFPGHLGKDLFWALNKVGIAVSTSSACSSTKMTPSSVLAALGLSDEENLEALRISIGLLTTKEDLEFLLNQLKGIIK